MTSRRPTAGRESAPSGSTGRPVRHLPPIPPDRPRGVPLVSVVVPTLGRPDLLGRCLEALARQTLPEDQYEVLVVDDGPASDEESPARTLVRRLDARRPGIFRYVANEGPPGPASARNTGWRRARGAIVAFTDDDTVPDPGWLAAGTAAFSDGIGGVMGRLVMPLPPRPTDYQRDAAGLERAEFVTANCFYRREALEAVGGFDERFELAWREDTDLQFRALEAGFRLDRQPSALVVHPVRPAPWGVSVQQQRKALFNPLLYKKHPDLYRRHIGRSPRWYYAAAAALVTVLVAVFRRRRRLALTAAGLWLALTVGFALRRLTGARRSPAHVAEMLVTSAVIPPLSLYWRIRGAVRFRVLFW